MLATYELEFNHSNNLCEIDKTMWLELDLPTAYAPDMTCSVSGSIHSLHSQDLFYGDNKALKSYQDYHTSILDSKTAPLTLDALHSTHC